MANEIQHTVCGADRAAAHAALDRWLDECTRAASDAHEIGIGGYVGRVKLCAFVDDYGIRVRIERSFSIAL